MSFYEKSCEKYYRFYPVIESFFKEKPTRLAALKIFGKVSTIVMYLSYVGLIINLLITGDSRLFRVIAVPFGVFVIVTAIRRRINAPRPYEKYPITPLIHKSTKGNSCPSRHSACAAVIALSWLYISPFWGVLLLVMSLLIAASRPLMGVHFPLDPVFGVLLAVVIGGIGFLIP